MSTLTSTSKEKTVSQRTKPEAPRSEPSLDSRGVPINSEFLSFPSKEELTEIFGTHTSKAANGLLCQIFSGLGNDGKFHRPYVIAMVIELAPRDALEAMLVTQYILAYLECMRATGDISDAQDEQSCEAHARIMSRMSQITTNCMDRLQKKRLRSQTNLSIGQVVVQKGGQAIVGSVRINSLSIEVISATDETK